MMNRLKTCSINNNQNNQNNRNKQEHNLSIQMYSLQELLNLFNLIIIYTTRFKSIHHFLIYNPPIYFYYIINESFFKYILFFTIFLYNQSW